jgi:hypothetical protein
MSDDARSQAHAVIIQNAQRATSVPRRIFPDGSSAIVLVVVVVLRPRLFARCNQLTALITHSITSTTTSAFCFPTPLLSQQKACYFPSQTLPSDYFLMEIDFQAIQTDELKSRIGELRRYL